MHFQSTAFKRIACRAALAFGLVLALLLSGCRREQGYPADLLVGRVLVVINESSPESITIGTYYAKVRKIPSGNVVRIKCAPGEAISMEAYKRDIEGPISRETRGKDYIVLTRGVPIRIKSPQAWSVDALLAGMEIPVDPVEEVFPAADLSAWRNPYYLARTPFEHGRYKIFLVTRLDGYTVEQALKLVQHSLEAKPVLGPFYLNKAANRDDGGYQIPQQFLDQAYVNLHSQGYKIERVEDCFRAPSSPVIGYASWGSNDKTFRLKTYHKIRFLPGALAQTYVSTSARTFRRTKANGQSLIADLIEQGVTGVIGYVSEPYASALARPDYMFDRYTEGANLAESFYSSIPMLKWKEVVIGDPLCRPYRKD